MGSENNKKIIKPEKESNYNPNDVLDPLKKPPKKYKIIAFDLETHNNNQTMTIGDIYDGEQHYTHYNTETMRKQLLQRDYSRKTYIIATNLAFDFNVIFKPTDYPHFQIIDKGGHYIYCKHKELKNKFIDSINHVPSGVEKAGEMIGKKKLTPPTWLGKKKPETEKEWEELRIYNQRDTEVTWELMTQLQKGYNELGCELKTTIASTALDLFRRRYLETKMIKEEAVLRNYETKNTYDIPKLIRSAYYGGRTEAFKRGKIDLEKSTIRKRYYKPSSARSLHHKWLYCFDFNSLFPSMMRKDLPVPQSIIKIWTPTTKNIEDYEGVSEVTIKAPYINIPLLPYRDQQTKKLIFPIGEWRAAYNHNELRRSLELKYEIKAIHKQIIYRNTEYYFLDMITELYRLRMKYRKTKDFREYIIKIIMNSSYGKFAQRSTTKIDYYDKSKMSDKEYFGKYQHTPSVEIGTSDIGYYIEDKAADAKFIFPIISSYITSYARIELFNFITRPHIDPFYVDTDSCWTTYKIPTSDDLGALKVEHKIRKCIIVKPKHYYLGEDYRDVSDQEYEEGKEGSRTTVKVKGLPRATEKDFIDILAGRIISYKKFNKPRESFRRGLDVNAVRDEEKAIGLEDNKREWHKHFSPEYLQDDSKPLTISQTMPIPEKIDKARKTAFMRNLEAQSYHDNKLRKERKEFLDSDLFDRISVGDDITAEEFLKNEIWYDIHG